MNSVIRITLSYFLVVILRKTTTRGSVKVTLIMTVILYNSVSLAKTELHVVHLEVSIHTFSLACR